MASNPSCFDDISMTAKKLCVWWWYVASRGGNNGWLGFKNLCMAAVHGEHFIITVRNTYFDKYTYSYKTRLGQGLTICEIDSQNKDRQLKLGIIKKRSQLASLLWHIKKKQNESKHGMYSYIFTTACTTTIASSRKLNQLLQIHPYTLNTVRARRNILS